MDTKKKKQISTGGKHKYLINGQNATAQRVADLFCSVQLNVNNPNFLIMQGKITKVLNMKPVEILSMIEEAAGTKTYDIKKQNALATIDKKNTKLNEIERVLREDITPTIERLKLERASYLEYQKCEREYAHLHKITVAHTFYECEQVASANDAQRLKIEAQTSAAEQRCADIVASVSKLRDEIETAKRAMRSQHENEQIVRLECALKECKMEATKVRSELQFAAASTKAEKKKHAELSGQVAEATRAIEQKQARLDEIKKTLGGTSAHEAAEANLKKAQRAYEALCCGFVANDDGDDDGEGGTAQDQLLRVKSKLSEQETRVKMADAKVHKALKDSGELESQLAKDSREYEERSGEFARKKEAHERVAARLAAVGYDKDKAAALVERRRALAADIGRLRDESQSLYGKFPNLRFEYKTPPGDFERSRVKGLVANLFSISDQRFCQALETAAGGKLYNLVVDTDETGRLILKHGELKRKCTVIPMNQIRSNKVSEQVLRTAQSLVGAENVFTALSLVTFDPVYRPVMEYVFGSRLVCFSLEQAKKVAFHPQIMTSTITLDGDSFDPEGIITGKYTHS